MAKVTVDGQDIEVPDHYTILQACEEAGAEIPRFCFHDRLSIAGNCRMCLVEVVGAPKPVASCAMGVKDLRPGKDGEPPQVNTRTPYVKKAREGVMEFLLINHPLDCPICDQGGECDLQDQAMLYGVDSSRYVENKRAVEDKYIGPLVKTIMNRCIHCTRCVRFTTEVAGVSELGATGRGEDMEITTYLEHAMSSELQGNVVDLCPVGALTSKPYAFQARPWELTKTESVDVMDAVGSSIRVDTKGREVMRILPRLNEEINEEWISDKTRHVWDGLKAQRLDKPFVKIEGRFRASSWGNAFDAIKAKIENTDITKIGAIAGDLASVEDMFALKGLMKKLGSGNIDCRPAGSALNPDYGRGSYIFNPSIEGIEDADAILIVGSNPRLEAAILNARIRKTWRATGLPIAYIGEPVDLTYDAEYLGNSPNVLTNLISGKTGFSKILKNAEKPLIILGEGAVTRSDGVAIYKATAELAQSVGALSEDWNGFAFLHNAASRVGGLDIGFVPQQGGKDTKAMLDGKMDVLFLLGADEIDTSKLSNTFVIYIGTHGDAGAHSADVILPAATYTEKHGVYVNTEGRVQSGLRAAFPPGEAREDWAIVRALSEALGQTLPYDSFGQLRAALVEEFPHFKTVNMVSPGGLEGLLDAKSEKLPKKPEPFKPMITDYYMTNPIARASKVMAECSSMKLGLVAEAAE
jgi:NADH-quinone oxidoreductase subunit G